MLRVLVAQYGVACGYAPVNAEASVEYAYAAVGLGVVEVVALVLEHGHVAKHREAVGKPLWYEELAVVLLCELHCHVLPVGR